MTTAYKKAGTDLDSLFQARVGAAAANVGYLSNAGVDLSQRFEKRGTALAIANTGFKSAGTDLAQIFKDINAGTVTVAGKNYTDSTVAAGRNADAGYGLSSDGNQHRYLNFVDVDDGDWIAPLSSAPGGYAVRATIVSGTQSSGDSVGAWLNFSSGVTYQWHVQRLSFAGVGTNTLVLTIEIRDAGGTILSTATVTLNAQLT